MGLLKSILGICDFLAAMFYLVLVTTALRMLWAKIHGDQEKASQLKEKLNPFKTGLTETTKSRLVFSAIIILGTFDLIGTTLFKESRIGSLFEAGEYRVKYYVNVFPENSKSKNYRLPADIFATFEEVENMDQDGNSHSRSVRTYLIEKVYFENGGTRSFENAPTELKIGKRNHVSDDDGTWWYIELTNEKVN